MSADSGNTKWGRPVRAIAVATLAMVVAGCAAASGGPDGATAEPGGPAATGSAPPTEASGDAAAPPAVDPDWPRWGFTHTGVSANNITPAFERTVAESLSRTPMLQNQHIMGFGALNPQPSRNDYFWEDLDSRTNFMKESGGTQILTLCCAPDWMKGGPEGPTSQEGWEAHLEDAPYPEHYDDFAKLAATVAERYRDVQYFMVWNEFKGFWPNHSRPADYKGYTQLYNKVYDAVKAVRPDAKVGGPYLGFDSNRSGRSELRGDWGVINQNVLDAFDYWFEHKKGADFVVVDGASPTDAHELLPDEFGALSKFSAVTTWLRQKTGNLPVWWSEWYFEPEDGTVWPEGKRLAVQAASMMEFVRSGAATALFWNPQTKDRACKGCLWDPRTGQPLASEKLIGEFVKWFPAGAKLDDVSSSDPKVRVLAQPQQLLLVNTANSRVATEVDGKTFELKPYEVRWSSR
ncbi:xylan 1,4-beta-xylosidase [Actinomadura sp. ATCC 31491]|uniref:Xylan 1,4-beta-xylosidase n=1 Tax=Actinomadura luzonensis TaxID=2805427 RepID=A0ABT0G816_9ACTN|nr:xylan 1,4-beta-xylosidase [Actinomadura luzonensis]MCK2220246.1 xylan 1,4-beta-xylosidase [Actinomadura luzonensis]